MAHNEMSALNELPAHPESPEQTSTLSPIQLNSPGLTISDSAMMKNLFSPSSEIVESLSEDIRLAQ